MDIIYVWSTMLYADSKIWTVTATEERKTIKAQSSEMWYYIEEF